MEVLKDFGGSRMVAMHWLSRGEIVALGWTLLHFIWQGAVLALAYAVIDCMTRRTSSAVRYIVALGALTLMPLVVVATFDIEMRTASPTNATTQREAAIARFYLNGIPTLVAP